MTTTVSPPETAPRIVIAGDDETLRQQVSSILMRSHVVCPPSHAVSFELALDRVAQLTPDLVLLLASADGNANRRALQSIDRLIDGRVLVIGPKHDSQSVLEMLQAGADAFVDQGKLDEELTAALARYRNKVAVRSTQRAQGRLIGVLGASGGCGASTVASNIATCLAQKYGSTALVDLRFATADLTAMLGLQPQYSLADFCERLDRVDARMFEQFLTPHPSGVRLIASPLDSTRAGDVTSRGVCRALAMAAARFPYVVVDLDNRPDEVQREAICQLHQLLIVLRLDYVSIRNARRLLDGLATEASHTLPIRLVANRYRQPKEVPLQQAEQALGRRIELFIQEDAGRMNYSINKGKPVVLECPRATVSRQLSAVASAVNGQM